MLLQLLYKTLPAITCALVGVIALVIATRRYYSYYSYYSKHCVQISNNSYSNSCLAITRGWAAIPVGGQLLPVMLPALRRFEALRTRCDGVRPACRWRRLVRDRRRCGAPVHAPRAARPATEADARRQPRAAGFLRCWCSWPLSRARSSPGWSVRTSSAGFVTLSVLK